MHLFEYCIARKITFTRSRPGNKNDGAHVEQKNWTHVRELVGYLRFDTAAELAVLNRIWELDRGFTNLLLTQQKLVRRERVGAKVLKRHDAAATPFERAIRAGVLSPARRGHSLGRVTPFVPARPSGRSPGSVSASSTWRCPRTHRLRVRSTAPSTHPIVRSF